MNGAARAVPAPRASPRSSLRARLVAATVALPRFPGDVDLPALPRIASALPA